MNSISIIIKITLSVLLLVCLFDMPYGYYQLVRYLALVGFGILAFFAKKNDNTTEMIIYGALALLFQPFIKIVLGRELWNIVDILVSIGLMISIFIQRKSKN